MTGKAWKFGDSISTDLIAPGRFAHLRSNLPELTKHCLEDAREDYAPNVKQGDFVVGGNNFGLGSSREHAPRIIKMSGAQAVVAKSFARIFFRNSINIGLPAIEVDTDKIDEGDELELDLGAGKLINKTKNETYDFPPLLPAMQRILADGGLTAHIIKNNGNLNLG